MCQFLILIQGGNDIFLFTEDEPNYSLPFSAPVSFNREISLRSCRQIALGHFAASLHSATHAVGYVCTLWLRVQVEWRTHQPDYGITFLQIDVPITRNEVATRHLITFSLQFLQNFIIRFFDVSTPVLHSAYLSFITESLL
jgi:hypothetical protein